MPAPNGRQTAIDQRQAMVARLSLHKLTQREIVDKLYHHGVKNPDTGKAYTVATVNRDLKQLRQAWRERAAEDIDLRQAEHLAELEEVRRAGWVKEDLHAVLKALKQEADILGFNAPVKSDVTTKGESLNEGRISDERRLAATMALVEQAKARAISQNMDKGSAVVSESGATDRGDN